MSRIPPHESSSATDAHTPVVPRPTLLKRFVALLVAILVIAAGVAVAWTLVDSRPKAKRKPKARRARLVDVRPVEFGPQRTEIMAMGTVRPARQVVAHARVSGEIVEMSPELEPGGRIAKDTVIARLDPTDHRLAVRERISALAQAEAELQLEQGRQAIARHELALLGGTGGQADSDPSDHDLMLRKPQLATVQARIEAARAAVDKARLSLRRTAVKAPFDAIVVARHIDLGAQVGPTTPLASLVGTEAYWIEVSVPVDQLRWIRIPETNTSQGSPARIYDEAAWGPGVYRTGRVVRLSAGVEAKGRMARLIISVPQPLSPVGSPRADTPVPLLLDAYVRVVIEGRSIPRAAPIDRSLLRGENIVWVRNPAGTLEIRTVDVAFRGPTHLLVTNGIREGEHLVASDLAAPVAGMPLRIKAPKVALSTPDSDSHPPPVEGEPPPRPSGQAAP